MAEYFSVEELADLIKIARADREEGDGCLCSYAADAGNDQIDGSLANICQNDIGHMWHNPDKPAETAALEIILEYGFPKKSRRPSVA